MIQSGHTIFKMASVLLSRSVRPVFNAFLRPFLTSSSAHSVSKGEIIVDKTEKAVDTVGDDEQVRIILLVL